jgi:hypothetical protein
MVVDLRHVRGAAYVVRAAETATTEEVPAILDKALAAAAGQAPQPIPADAMVSAVGESGLQAFRKAHARHAEARDALAKRELALKEADARRQAGGGAEAEAAWRKAKAAREAARLEAAAAREEAVRVLRALGQGKDPATFHPPVPSFPALGEETWLGMQKRMIKERALADAMTARYQAELMAIVPPPRESRYEKVHEGVILGFGTTPDDAKSMMEDGVSCFNGKSYRSINDAAERAQAAGKPGVGGAVVVSFGSEGMREPFGGKQVKDADFYVDEALRVAADHVTDGAASLHTPQARAALERMSGKEFDRLAAHSNGATVAEALIRNGSIRVNELDVIGGDMSLAKRGAYQDLVDSGKVKRVVVWANLNDPVPWGTSAAPLELAKTAGSTLETVARKVIGASTAGVEYRLMWGGDHRIAAPSSGVVGTAKQGVGSLLAPHYVESSYFPGIADYYGTAYTVPARVARGG